MEPQYGSGRDRDAALPEFWRAARQCAPFLISSFPMGTVFGTLARTKGLTAGETLTMSGFVYSGAAQFSGLQLLAEAAPLLVLALVTLLLSLRFLVYGIALVEHIRRIPLRLRMVFAFGLVDPVFFIVRNRVQSGIAERNLRWFFAWCVLLIYVNWVLSTFVGFALGDSLTGVSSRLRLDFLADAAFIGLLAPYLRNGKAAAAAGATAILVPVFHGVPYGGALLLSCLAAVLLAWLAPQAWGRLRHGRMP